MTFVHSDALEYLRTHGREFDAVHASPPCRAYTHARGGSRYRHPDLIGEVREALQETGRPWVIENVVGAPLIEPLMLCGTMFRLRMYRHRLFESSFEWRVPRHDPHIARVGKMGRAAGEGELLSLVGNFSGLGAARAAMGMPWANQDGIRQAVPPVYTEWIGWQLQHVMHHKKC